MGRCRSLSLDPPSRLGCLPKLMMAGVDVHPMCTPRKYTGADSVTDNVGCKRCNRWRQPLPRVRNEKVTAGTGVNGQFVVPAGGQLKVPTLRLAF